jgi:transcriptional regulator with XRE-family HTH domain
VQVCYFKYYFATLADMQKETSVPALNYGSNIKKFRELKNITREQMAADLDMSVSGYSKIERNEIDLTISRLQQIAQILGVDISQILNFDASQIFNISNNQYVQGLGAKAESMHFYGDDYKEKYIRMLEDENARLKALLER